MNTFIRLFLVICFCSWQDLKNCEGKIGSYRLSSIDEAPSLFLELKTNGLFYCKSGNDLEKFDCTGNWFCNRDTVYLNSKFVEGLIPMPVIETKIKSNNNQICFELTNANPDKLVNGIQVKFKDKSEVVFLDDKKKYFVFNRNKLIGFSMFFGETLVSNYYEVKDSTSNDFVINIDASGASLHYLTLKNKKLLFKDSDLFLLNDSNEFIYSKNDTIRTPIHLSKS